MIQKSKNKDKTADMSKKFQKREKNTFLISAFILYYIMLDFKTFFKKGA